MKKILISVIALSAMVLAVVALLVVMRDESGNDEVEIPIVGTTTIQGSYPNHQDDVWTLVWSDEFTGQGIPDEHNHNGLDLRNWEIQTGNGATMGLTGWGNGEIQYYHGDNVWVEDGMLHIEARRHQYISPSEGIFEFTSGRIRSVGRSELERPGAQTRFGRIEARISLPYGESLWPAFWMMPEYDVHGTWAASGEIDIMEARGREPYYSTSAIHYGGSWPHNTHSHGSVDLRHLNPDLSINSFINYAVEWEPGEMRFLIDNEVFWTISQWHTLAPGQEDLGVSYMFPAPFDQYFHILLNLAIGGWFDGGREPADDLFDERRLMRVEYVRIYELTNRELNWVPATSLQPEEIPTDAKDDIETSGQIDDVYFTNIIRTAPLPGSSGFPTRAGWEVFAGSEFGGGIAGYEVTDDQMIHIQITAAGGYVHANQLMQRVSIIRGHHYRLQFDARAAENRQINARLSQGGGDAGWGAFSNFDPQLTTITQTFTHYFTANDITNINARLEFNLGGNTADVWIGNVSLVRVTEVPEDIDITRTPLPDGNLIWNGTFEHGSSGMMFWRYSGADFQVNTTLAERLTIRELTISNIGNDAVLFQNRIPLANDAFRLSFDAIGTGEIDFRIVNMVTGELHYETTLLSGTVTHEFTLANLPVETREMRLEFDLSRVVGTLELNNMNLQRLTTNDRNLAGIRQHLLDNGDFFAGLRGWEHESIYGGSSSVTFDNGAHIDITTLGDHPWSVLLMQNGHQVTAGFTYEITFYAATTVDRDIQFVLETPEFSRRIAETMTLTAGAEPQRMSFTFDAVTAEILDLKFLMGAMSNAATGVVTISDVSFNIIDPESNRLPTIGIDDSIHGQDVVLRYSATTDGLTENPVVTINGDETTVVRSANGEITIPSDYFRQGVNTIVISALGYETHTFTHVLR